MGVRLLIFASSLAVGVLLASWITISTWRQMGRLKEEFASIQADRFVLDDYLRAEILRLNDELQGYRPQPNPANRDKISKELHSLGQWLAIARSGLDNEKERAAFARIEDAYKVFEETAIEATKLGAYEYLVKPFEADDLLTGA
jgi:hypothetical protein